MAGLDCDGPHAVVQSFREPPKNNPPSVTVKRGLLDNKHCVCACKNIVDTVAVVKNENCDGMEHEFFVVSNSDQWLSCFHEIFDSLDNPDDSNDDIHDDGEEYIDAEDHDSPADSEDDDSDEDSEEEEDSDDDSKDEDFEDGDPDFDSLDDEEELMM